ncbi:GNAT family N-acetyltransferase [Labedella endophytica]|uniref:N-acetyltransferase n=1 Tax=Labedella endophytica TaxID=1523160 RepID=A0A433JTW9_9MICO|nr:GNAT family N-acetyltransferase [Labedella endophytica]RUR01379.1 N-acetyltransferase [Labedella endophytica]
MTEPVVLRTARLELSAPVADDVDAITAACQDPAIQRWTTVPSPYTREDAENFVNSYVTAGWAAGTARTWAVRRRRVDVDVHVDGLELVGMVGLEGIHEGAGEIGYWLAPAARGDGLMPEAVAAVIDYGFSLDGPALARIVWRALAGNVPSASVARRAGLRFEGTRRLGAVDRTRRADEWTAAILETDDRSPADGWPAETLGS